MRRWLFILLACSIGGILPTVCAAEGHPLLPRVDLPDVVAVGAASALSFDLTSSDPVSIDIRYAGVPIIDRHGNTWKDVHLDGSRSAQRITLAWDGRLVRPTCSPDGLLTIEASDGELSDRWERQVTLRVPNTVTLVDPVGDVALSGRSILSAAALSEEGFPTTSASWLDLTRADIVTDDSKTSIRIDVEGAFPDLARSVYTTSTGTIDNGDRITLALLVDTDCTQVTGDAADERTEFPRTNADTAILFIGETLSSQQSRRWFVRMETWDDATRDWIVRDIPPAEAPSISVSEGTLIAFIPKSLLPTDRLGYPGVWRVVAAHAVPEYREPILIDVLSPLVANGPTGDVLGITTLRSTRLVGSIDLPRGVNLHDIILLVSAAGVCLSVYLRVR